MACILVVAECEEGERLRLVLDEQVDAVELGSDSSCSQLIERLGWAIVDAQEFERDGNAALESATRTPQGRSPRRRPRGRTPHAPATHAPRREAKECRDHG